MGFLPRELEQQFEFLERFGPLLILGLFLMGSVLRIPILWMIMRPFVSFFSILFAGVDLSGV